LRPIVPVQAFKPIQTGVMPVSNQTPLKRHSRASMQSLFEDMLTRQALWTAILIR
jgi:hypothetical protein